MQASLWKFRHWRATFAWSILAELLKIQVFKTTQYMPSPIIEHSLSHFSLSCMLHGTHQSRGTERKEIASPREQQLGATSW